MPREVMNLQEQALSIINEYNLIKLFGSLGETHLVGNVALNTTVKPDIDIQIYQKLSNFPDTEAKIVKMIQELGFRDYITRELKQSQKRLISFVIEKYALRWTIDITITQDGSGEFMGDSYLFYLEYKDKLTESNLKTIRRLKKVYLDSGKLHNSVSYYIYRAVLDYNITNIDEFRNFMEKEKQKT